jgi:IS4 transposase
VTYIADRGYLSFELFKNNNDKPAYFIIRVRKRLHIEIEQQLPIQLIDAVKAIFFHVTDELVRFNSEPHGRTYRRISFRTRQTLFVLVTIRFDLTTFDIIRLYAFRWQIELFFRYFNRSLKAIHLLNSYENGVTIRFYMVLIAHLLALRSKQQQLQLCLFKKQELLKQSSHHRFGSI